MAFLDDTMKKVNNNWDHQQISGSAMPQPSQLVFYVPVSKCTPVRNAYGGQKRVMGRLEREPQTVVSGQVGGGKGMWDEPVAGAPHFFTSGRTRSKTGCGL